MGSLGDAAHIAMVVAPANGIWYASNGAGSVMTVGAQIPATASYTYKDASGRTVIHNPGQADILCAFGNPPFGNVVTSSPATGSVQSYQLTCGTGGVATQSVIPPTLTDTSMMQPAVTPTPTLPIPMPPTLVTPQVTTVTPSASPSVVSAPTIDVGNPPPDVASIGAPNAPLNPPESGARVPLLLWVALGLGALAILKR